MNFRSALLNQKKWFEKGYYRNNGLSLAWDLGGYFLGVPNL